MTTTVPTTVSSDSYLVRVAHVVAYESARLGRESGSITSSLVGVILTARAWDVPKGEGMSLQAFVDGGGPEGTYRVARRIAALLLNPAARQDGDSTFRKALEAAHVMDTPSEEIAACSAAYVAYKGKQGWQKFTDALAGNVKDSDKATASV